MTKNLILHGVPNRVARDGWWLDDNPAGPGAPHAPMGLAPLLRAGAVLLALVALADGLFWAHPPGLSLALFAFAILLGAMAVTRPRRRPAGPALLLGVAALPVAEHVQALSLAFLAAGLIAALTLLHTPPGTAPGLIWQGARARLARWPLGGIRAGLRGLGTLARVLRSAGPARFRGLARDWGLALGGALILLGLLAQANPVLSDLLARMIPDPVWPQDQPARALVWAVTAALVWALIADDTAPSGKVGAAPRPARALPGITPGSVRRALWVFNALLAVQTGMDVSILLGGAALPDGLSHADYAHRGAYPLLLTAMLAGVFALTARPFLKEHRSLRPLLLLWLAQNVALSGSAALRLDLYVDAFGLTHLRLWALVWMALVAAGLGLTGWAALRGQSNRWLLLRCAVLGLTTLYGACFVNAAALVAATNLARAETGRGAPLDTVHLCRLGPMAAGAIGASSVALPRNAQPCLRAPEAIEDARDWGFRRARVLATLAATTGETR